MKSDWSLGYFENVGIYNKQVMVYLNGSRTISGMCSPP